MATMPQNFSTIRTVAELQHSFHEWLLSQGFGPENAVLLTTLAGVIAMLVVASIIDALARLVIRKLIPKLVDRLVDPKSTAAWKAALHEHTLAKRSAHILAALVVYLLTPQVLAAYPSVVAVVRNVIEGYLVLVTVIAINALLRAGVDVFRQKGRSSRLPLQFISQSAQTVVWLVGFVLVISVVFDQSVGVLLTGLAGATAFLALVFRDTVLGWVAGIQIVNSDLVREGDWIEVPEFNADGTVTDIGLITVLVRNWDKTVSSIPSYSLINGGFKNWRGMYNSGARRIKRALPIDASGVSYCTPEMLERLRKIEILREYIDHRVEKIEAFNQEHNVDESEPINGRRLTNIGLYRAYLQRYLEHNTAIRDDMTFMVRQLPPGPDGLKLEIYAFCAIQKWTEYETIQSDIFDHAIAALPAFGLSTYQYPSSGAANVPTAEHESKP